MPIFRFIILSGILIFSIPVAATDTPVDSLKTVLNTVPEDTNRVNTLLLLSKNYFNTDPQEAIRYGTQAKELSEKLNYQKGLAFSLKNIGMAYYRQAKYFEALDFWKQSVNVFEAIGDKVGEANILSNIGAIYFDQSDESNANDYYFKALKLAEEIGDKLRIATVLGNIGAVFQNKKATYDKALEYFLKALPLAEEVADQYILGTTLANLGEIYYLKGDFKTALPYYEQALKVSENTESEPYILNNIGKLYTKKADYNSAVQYHEKALLMGRKLDSKLDITHALLGLGNAHQGNGEIPQAISSYKEAESISIELNATMELKDAYEGLAKSYSKQRDFMQAYRYQTLFTSTKDKLYDAEQDKKLRDKEFSFNLERKEGQINLLNKDKALQEVNLKRQKLIRNVTFGGLSVVMMFLVVVFFQKKRITKEKQRSDELLLNILPSETAEELKATGSAKTKSFDLVSVMFTDFKNFTQASEKLSAEELVEEINRCYSAFDRIVSKYGIEKIKTIGDSYMCAGGLPVPNHTHPVDVVKAGLEMQAFIMQHKKERIEKDLPYFDLRLGIHTGNVVAGIVGIKKFAYDIWGDTVNTASRMESSGQIEKVNISGTTYELVKDHFICTHRGKIEAKNKGVIDMYFVEGIKS